MLVVMRMKSWGSFNIRSSFLRRKAKNASSHIKKEVREEHLIHKNRIQADYHDDDAKEALPHCAAA